MKGWKFGMVLVLVALLLVSAGCGSGGDGEEPEAAQPTAVSEEPVEVEPTKAPADVEPTDAPAEEEPTEVEPTEEPAEVQPTEAPADVDERGVPLDLPIPDDVEELVVAENQVRYLAAMDFDAVVLFYEEEMPKFGWEEQTRNIIGTTMGTLNYVKEGERVSIQFQWNENAKKTRVQINAQK